jgi:hypothetical protein
MKKLYGSIGVIRSKPWNGPQIVGPNEKTIWFHRGNKAKTMERSSKLWDRMEKLHGSIAGNKAKTMERSSKLWDQMKNLHGFIGVSLSLSLSLSLLL